MRELLAFLGLDVPMKYVDQFGMEGVQHKYQKELLLQSNINIHKYKSSFWYE
jgi:hypothetical protein